MRKFILFILIGSLAVAGAGCSKGAANSVNGTTGAGGSDGSDTSSGDTSATSVVVEVTDTDLQNADLQIPTVLELTASSEVKAVEDIVILYTNDVHCAVENNLGYRSVEVMRDTLESAGKSVILVDSGDSIQGDYIGSLTDGEAIVKIMNSLGYDAMALGNHEFDYGVDRLQELDTIADFDFVSCNFIDKETGKTVFKPYSMVECDGIKFAFIGISTPDTFKSSTPAYFQDEDGNFIYDMCADETGDLLAEAVTQTAAQAREDGADYVIALSHLGIEMTLSPFTSAELIPQISGVDAYLDGHSHSTVDSNYVKDADGHAVPVSQTGTKLSSIGMLTFDENGAISTTLINSAEVEAVIEEEVSVLDEELDVVIGKTDFPLIITDPANDKRIVRLAETNLGDFVTDAIRDYTGADIAIINGGGLRADLPSGDITNRNIQSVMPFNNEVSMISCSGQQILDALEYSVIYYPNEFGGFLQVSGLTFDVDVDVPSGVAVDDMGMFIGIEGDSRRISNVMVNGEPLDPAGQYTLGGISYTLLNSGDGYTMFSDCEILLSSSITDNRMLVEYITDKLGGVISEDYSDPYGQDRINFK